MILNRTIEAHCSREQPYILQGHWPEWCHLCSLEAGVALRYMLPSRHNKAVFFNAEVRAVFGQVQYIHSRQSKVTYNTSSSQPSPICYYVSSGNSFHISPISRHAGHLKASHHYCCLKANKPIDNSVSYRPPLSLSFVQTVGDSSSLPLLWHCWWRLLNAISVLNKLGPQPLSRACNPGPIPGKTVSVASPSSFLLFLSEQIVQGFNEAYLPSHT